MLQVPWHVITSFHLIISNTHQEMIQYKDKCKYTKTSHVKAYQTY